MTLLETIRRHGGSTAILDKIDDLRAGPVPYAFEQGKIPREALDQGGFWRDKSGKLYEIEEMHPVHAVRALTKLFEAYAYDSSVSIESTPLFKALSSRASVKA